MSIVSGVREESSAETLIALAKLLSDPRELESEYQRLQAAKDDAQKVIDLAGPAKDILALRDELQAGRDKVDDLLAQAQDRAKDIIDEATQEKARLAADAKAELARVREQADAIYVTAQAKLAQAVAQLAKADDDRALLKLALDKADAATADADAARKRADQEQRELSLRKAKLQDAAAMVADALGADR